MSQNEERPAHSTSLHILTVATRLFTERGFTNVSVREICEAAGVTPPTLYYHYRNKEGLFQAVVQRAVSMQEFRDALTRAVEEQPDPEAQLQVFIHVYLSSFPKRLLNPGLFLQNSTRLYDLSANRFRVELDGIRALAKRILRAGIEAGKFKGTDLDKATSCLLGMLGAFITDEAYFHRPYQPNEVAPFVFDLILRGLQR